MVAEGFRNVLPSDTLGMNGNWEARDPVIDSTLSERYPEPWKTQLLGMKSAIDTLETVRHGLGVQ